MNSSKSDWFQSMLDLIERVERRSMGTEEYLEAERQWALAKEELLLLVPEEKRQIARQFLNQMEEASLQMYNLTMEETVVAVEFKDFDR